LRINTISAQKDTVYIDKYAIKGLGVQEDGMPVGQWIYWHLNGNKQSEGSYKNGKYQGIWKNWYSNGNLQNRVKYLNGELTQIFEIYHPSGKKYNCLDYFREGLDFFNNKNYKKSLPYMNKAVELCPDTGLIWGYRSHIKIILGDLKGSLDDITQLIQLEPKKAIHYMSRGELYILDRNYSEAIDDLNQSINLDSLSSKSYFLRGKAYEGLENYNLAISDYSLAILLSENNDLKLNALKNRAFCNLLNDHFKNAIRDYNTYLELNPKDAYVLNKRAFAKYKINEKESACRDWKQACKLDLKYCNDKIYISKCD